MLDVCVVGHVTRDVNSFQGRRQPPRPGGTAYYAGIAYRALGLETAVVTRMRPDDAPALLGDLERRGIAVHRFDSAATTCFENRYGADRGMDDREQRVSARAAPFEAGDLDACDTRAFHFGPLLPDDMAPAVLEAARATGALTALDGQGLVRRLEGGRVRPCAWDGPAALLAAVDVLKVDLVEAGLLTGRDGVAEVLGHLAALGPSEVLLTLGSRGSYAFSQGRRFGIPAFVPPAEVDPTGCGDTYVAGYISRRLRADDVEASGRYAAALASVKLEAMGPARGPRDRIEDRIAQLSATAPRRLPPPVS